MVVVYRKDPGWDDGYRDGEDASSAEIGWIQSATF